MNDLKNFVVKTIKYQNTRIVELRDSIRRLEHSLEDIDSILDTLERRDALCGIKNEFRDLVREVNDVRITVHDIDTLIKDVDITNTGVDINTERIKNILDDIAPDIEFIAAQLNLLRFLDSTWYAQEDI